MRDEMLAFAPFFRVFVMLRVMADIWVGVVGEGPDYDREASGVDRCQNQLSGIQRAKGGFIRVGEHIHVAYNPGQAQQIRGVRHAELAENEALAVAVYRLHDRVAAEIIEPVIFVEVVPAVVVDIRVQAEILGDLLHIRDRPVECVPVADTRRVGREQTYIQPAVLKGFIQIFMIFFEQRQVAQQTAPVHNRHLI